MIRVLLINNDGGGVSDYVETAEGTTVAEFIEQHVRDFRPGRLQVRVNRRMKVTWDDPVEDEQGSQLVANVQQQQDRVSKDYVLQNNDRVTLTPLKIDAGC